MPPTVLPAQNAPAAAGTCSSESSKESFGGLVAVASHISWLRLKLSPSLKAAGSTGTPRAGAARCLARGSLPAPGPTSPILGWRARDPLTPSLNPPPRSLCACPVPWDTPRLGCPHAPCTPHPLTQVWDLSPPYLPGGAPCDTSDAVCLRWGRGRGLAPATSLWWPQLALRSTWGSVLLAPSRAGLRTGCQGPAAGQQLFLAEKGGGAGLTLGDRRGVTPAPNGAGPWGPGRCHPGTEWG